MLILLSSSLSTVYSAHTTLLVAGSLVFFTYCRPDQLKLWDRGSRGPSPAAERLCSYIRWLCYSISCSGVLVVVGTRLHYSIDVLIALYLSIRIWHTYWVYSTFPEVKATSRIVSWLEDDAEVVAVDSHALHSFWWEEFVCFGSRRHSHSQPSMALKKEE